MLVSQVLYALGTCTSSATACNLLVVLESVLRRELALLRDRRARRLASDHLAARFTGGDMGNAGAGMRQLLHALLQLCYML
jgi:hypothetical protein